MNSFGHYQSDELKWLYEYLQEKFREYRPDVHLKKNGYVNSIEDNLIANLNLADFKSDFSQGKGNELDGKILAIHSSAALVVNCFAPFRKRGEIVDIPSLGKFKVQNFEKKCPTGLRGTPPHLDVLLSNDSGHIAIESKFTEHFKTTTPVFKDAYFKKEWEIDTIDGFFKEMNRICGQSGGNYSYLDAAQLIKHAIGLANTYCEEVKALVYLYWRPLDLDSVPVAVRDIILQHETEIEQFSSRVNNSALKFHALCYNELWDRMEKTASTMLKDQLTELRSRYSV